MLALVFVSHAQLPAPPTTTVAALRQMFDEAGVIFTGQVTAVRHIDPAGGSSGIFEADFAVDDAVLGATSNGIYTLREWIGLAPATGAALLIGRRYLIFLHAPGPAGLTSPVGGSDGIIPILPGNNAASPTTPDPIRVAAQPALTHASHIPARANLSAATSGAGSIGCPTSRKDVGYTTAPESPAALASANIDLRWIAARVLAPLAYLPSEPAAARPITSRAYSIRASTNFLDPEAGRTAPANNNPPASLVPASVPATSSSNYADMLILLHTWVAKDSGRDEQR